MKKRTPLKLTLALLAALSLGTLLGGCAKKQTIMQPIAQNFTIETEAYWEAVHPGFGKVFSFIRENDITEMEPGNYEIDGNDVYLIIMTGDLKPEAEAKLEVHDKYYDLQVPLSATEKFGYSLRGECRHPSAPMDWAKDIQFFEDPIKEVITVRPMQFIVFAPEHAHAPMIGEGQVRKAVAKIRL